MNTVDVVIPFWNAENWLGRAIESVLAQQGVDVSVIAVDDGSTDGSVEVARSFKDKVTLVTGPNRGACVARNEGLALARCHYVLFLDADDYLEHDALDAWIRTAVETSADIVLGPFAYHHDGMLTAGARPKSPYDGASILAQWLSGWFTPPCAVLWRRAFVEMVGGWNPTLSRNQDGELAMRALLRRPRVVVAEAGRGIYVQHPSVGRVSRRSGAAVLNEQFGTLCGLWADAQTAGFEHVRENFARAFYQVAYEAFATSHHDIGCAALAQARALGLTGHVGSFRHCALSSMLGLERKLKLSRCVRRISHTVRS